MLEQGAIQNGISPQVGQVKDVSKTLNYSEHPVLEVEEVERRVEKQQAPKVNLGFLQYT